MMVISLLGMMFASAPAQALASEDRAVHAVVPLGIGAEPAPVQLADELSKALEAVGLKVVPRAQVVESMQRFRHPASLDLGEMRARFDNAVDSTDVAATVESYDAVVRALEEDPDPSPATIELLQEARLQLVSALYNLAALSDDRMRVAEIQARIFSHLEDALRTDPLVTMPVAQYSPAVRRLLDVQRQRIKGAPRGGLEVRSTPSGALVRLEGRKVGRTPYDAVQGLLYGDYRVWVEDADGCRSRPRLLRVGDRPVAVQFDLAFECTLQAEQGALRLRDQQLFSSERAAAAGRVVGADRLVLTGRTQYEGEHWIYAVLYDVNTARALRRAAVQLDSDGQRTLDGGRDAASVLVEFLSADGPPAGANLQVPLPVEQGQASVLVVDSAPEANAVAAPGRPLPLLIGALGAGAAALVAGISSIVGVAVYKDAFAQIDASNEKVQSQRAFVGYNLGIFAAVGAGVCALGGVGLGTWYALAGRDADAAEDDGAAAPQDVAGPRSAQQADNSASRAEVVHER